MPLTTAASVLTDSFFTQTNRQLWIQLRIQRIVLCPIRAISNSSTRNTPAVSQSCDFRQIGVMVLDAGVLQDEPHYGVEICFESWSIVNNACKRTLLTNATTYTQKTACLSGHPSISYTPNSVTAGTCMERWDSTEHY